MNYEDPQDGILAEIQRERGIQDSRFGEQNWPMSTIEAEAEAGEVAVFWRLINDARQAQGLLAWDGILLEEVYEALAESDPAKQRAELIQVAAVAVAAIECLDRAAASAQA